MQAIEYQAQGYDAAAWRESSLAALRTDSGRLAQAIGSADPHGWWSAFAASYTELRASTIQRARKQLGTAAACALVIASMRTFSAGFGMVQGGIG